VTDNTELDTDAELDTLLKELGAPTHTSPRFAGSVPWVRLSPSNGEHNPNPHATGDDSLCYCRECRKERGEA
jgi:hypothetical protein